MNLKNSSYFFLVAVISFVFFYVVISYAKEESETIIPYPVSGGEASLSYPGTKSETNSPYVKGESLEDCVNNFDISKVNLKEADNAELAESFLKGYFLCKAVATDNQRLCDKLANPDKCLRGFNIYWSYYGKLIREGRISPQIISACELGADVKDKGRDMCDDLSRFILSGDGSVCEKEGDTRRKAFCKAVTVGNSSFCPDNDCKELIFYLQAIKASEIKLCDLISNDNLQYICKGGVSADERVCEQNKGFKTFVRYYCERSLKSKKGRENEK